MDDETEFRGSFFKNIKHGKCFLVDAGNNVYKEFYQEGLLLNKINMKMKKSMIKDEPMFCSDIEKYEFTPEQEQLYSEFQQKIYPGQKEKIKLSQLGRITNGHSFSSIFSNPRSNYDTVSLDDYKNQLDSLIDIVENKKIEEWSVQEVKIFFEKINMQQYSQNIERNYINGKVLIKLDQKDLSQMGIQKKGDLLCILDSIKKLQSLSRWENQKKYLEKEKLIQNVEDTSVQEKIMSYYQDQNNMVIENEDDSSVNSVELEKQTLYQKFNSHRINKNSSSFDLYDSFQNNSHIKESKDQLVFNIIDPNILEKGKYISQGGFGKVYLGSYNNEKVAIKCYERYSKKKEALELSFLKEIEILSLLRHPNILLYMGMSYDKATNEWMMISEYLPNGSLYDHLYKDDYDDIPQIYIPYMINSIINAMTYTHSRNILHCDLKSSNILIDEQWHIKVADFGLSKKIIKIDRKNIQRVGTLQWMAPEIFRDQPNTKYTDVWSFGLIVWEILFKSIPFKDFTYEKMKVIIGYNEQELMSYLWERDTSGLDPFLVKISQTCTKFNPIERPSFEKLSLMFENDLKNSPKLIQLIYNAIRIDLKFLDNKFFERN